MNIVPMMWVLPVTGPDKDRGRTCYVCQLGSAPVIAAFIKPDSPERNKYIEYVQKLTEKQPALKAFVVILTGPDETLKQELTNFAQVKNLTVPLAVLDPEIGLPDTVPVDDKADITLLLYRGRMFDRVIEYNADKDNLMTEFSGTEAPKVTNLSELEAAAEAAAPAAMMGVNAGVPPIEDSFTFRILNDVAENMIKSE